MNKARPDPSPRPPRRDPREVLDPDRRLLALAVLRLGGSRRMAARQAGCAHTTIARTAARDPEFAAKLAEAEGHAATDGLSRPRSEIDEDKLGKAADWIARHGIGAEVRRRPLVPLGGERVMMIVQYFIAFAGPLVRAEKTEAYHRLAQSALRHLADETRRAGQKPLNRGEEFQLLKSLVANQSPPSSPRGVQVDNGTAARHWCPTHPDGLYPESSLSRS